MCSRDDSTRLCRKLRERDGKARFSAIIILEAPGHLARRCVVVIVFGLAVAFLWQ